MDDNDVVVKPPALEAILRDTAQIGFDMASEPKTGMMLRALAASKPAGRILELGTGTGVATAWLLAGMDSRSRLTSIDNNADAQDIARRHLGGDSRVTFHLTDAAGFLDSLGERLFDLVFADTWAGKFTNLDTALRAVKIGGMYVVDDLLPQANWPEGHAEKVPPLVRALETRPGFAAVKLAWASGILILVRTTGA
jgi:predicted O-methyltransferase YrrM